jgi:tRNA U54 and U55 pseudouridine synthase Pus10
MKLSFLSILSFLVILSICIAAKKKATKATKTKTVDPKECEVCIANLDKIDKLVPAGKKNDKKEIEKAISTHCTLSGFGSEWKPNPQLDSPKDVKMCYIFEPIKKAISTPFATGMPKEKVCKRLKKDNPEVCEVKYRKF